MINIKVSTRLVILTKYKAYKIPLNKRGLLQCKNEYKIWKSGKGRKYLAPLLWYKLGIVCQERVKELDKLDTHIVLKVKKLFPELDIDNCDLYFKHNWGLHYGQQVLVDYGIDKTIVKMYNKR